MSQQSVDPSGSEGSQHGMSGAHALSSLLFSAPIDPSTVLSEQTQNVGNNSAPSATFPTPLPVPAETDKTAASPAFDPSNHPPMHPTTDRQRVRHSFDVFTDQILSLRDIALKRELRSGLHARLGDLAQEALDQFIARESQEIQDTQETQETHEHQRQQGQQAEQTSSISGAENQTSQSQETHDP